jgi:hypothetical protein
MKKQGPHAIVDGAQDALGLTILLRRVGTSQAKDNAVLVVEEAPGRVVVELAPVVSL